jgi:RNA polymerase sigma-70 factor (ECF subfamily)
MPAAASSGASVSASGADDFALMDAIASSRDADALRQFYDRHAAIVFAVCLRVLRDRHEAEELLIDIFHELWQRADRYDPLRGSPRTYLMTLTRSRAIDRRRRLVSSGALTAIGSGGGSSEDAMDLDDQLADTGASSSPADATLLAERRGLVIQALRRLDPQQRQAIECAYYDGLSHSEIARHLNKPLGTVKTYIRQGLSRLRRLMQGEEDLLSNGTASSN